MKRISMIIPLMLVAVAFSLGSARAQDITVEATLSDSHIYLGDAVELRVQVAGGEDIADPDYTPLADLAPQSLGRGSRSFSSIVLDANGRRVRRNEQWVEFTVRLFPKGLGVCRIPSVSIIVDGKTYRTDPLSVIVVEPDESRAIELRVSFDQARAFVGQTVAVNVDVLVFDSRVQIQSPRFSAADRSPSIEFGESSTAGSQGNTMEFFGVLAVFAGSESVTTPAGRQALRIRAVVPARCTEAGPQTFGPVVLSFTEKDKSDPFPTGRRMIARSPAARIDVLPLPSDGRPVEFSGLVGAFAIAAEAAPTSVNVGDPITLSVWVTGPAGAVGVTPPDLQGIPGLSAEFKLAPGGWETLDTGEQGQWHFQTTIRARHADIPAIPAIPLSYFDSELGRYAIASSEPIQIEVAPTETVTLADATVGAETTPTARINSPMSPALRGNDESSGVLRDIGIVLSDAMRSPMIIGAAVAPPVLYVAGLAIATVRKRRQPTPCDPRRALSRARRAHAHRRGPRGEKNLAALRAFLGGMLDAPQDTMTSADVLRLPPTLDQNLTAQLRSAMAGAESGERSPTPAGGEHESVLPLLTRCARALNQGSAS